MTNINEWCSVSQISGESGTNQITVNIEEYRGLEDRSHTLKVVSADGMKEVFVTIQQKALIPIFEVSTTSIDMTDETTATINVISNTEWSCITDASWINTDYIGAFGDAPVTVTAQEYDGTDRTAHIKFYIGNELVKTVEIVQTYIVQPPSDVENCFYIEPYNLGETITVEVRRELDPIVYIYSVDGTNTWTKYDNPDTGVIFPISITTKKRIYIKQFDYNREYNYYSPLKTTGLCRIGGNIETLLGTMKEKYAYQLFMTCGIVDASNLILPATTLAPYCYCAMFKYTELVNPPELPATTLADNCYLSMFEECDSLVKAPTLPATTLADSCYMGMFQGCDNLVKAPTLPATTLAPFCYSQMFQSCDNLVNAPTLPATTLAESCYQDMFTSCTSLVNAPTLPATTLAESCYWGMFDGCTSLVNAPALPATTLAPWCYYWMFWYCTSLNNITMLANDISANYCLTEWVSGVSSNGTFTKKQGVNIERGVNGIPNGWTVVEV